LDVPTPPANPDPANPIEFEMWKLEVKEHRIKEQEYSNFRAGLYNVEFGQWCSEALQDKLKSIRHRRTIPLMDGPVLSCTTRKLSRTLCPTN
jgi:hypothetical protein